MISFSEFLTEVFNTHDTKELTSYKKKWPEGGSSKAFKKTFTVDATEYEIDFYYMGDNIGWEVQYGFANMLTKDGKFDPTKNQKGKASKVISIVFNELLKFLQNHKPDKLKFSGDKDNGLAQFYQSLLPWLTKNLNQLGYDIHTSNGRSVVFFKITRKPE